MSIRVTTASDARGDLLTSTTISDAASVLPRDHPESGASFVVVALRFLSARNGKYTQFVQPV